MTLFKSILFVMRRSACRLAFKPCIFAWSVALATTACVRDHEPDGPCSTCPPDSLSENSVEVPVHITMGGVWQTDSSAKSAPPGSGDDPSWNVDGTAEAAATDKVRIVVFRRKDMDDLQVGENTAPFLYDPTNDQTVDCVWTSGQHRGTALGVLEKVYGYEYRLVAIAYSSTRENDPSGGSLPATGESGLFSLNIADGLAYDDFMATFTVAGTGDWDNYWKPGGLVGTMGHDDDDLSPYAVYGPQLFYGYCHTGDGNPVIKFAQDDDKTVPLTGTLYRGLAKVEVHINPDDVEYGNLGYGVTWLGLLADHVATQVKLTAYDDFLAPMAYVGTQGVIGTGKYTLVAYEDSWTGNEVVLTSYLLPVATRLALRIRADRTGLHMGWNGQIDVANTSMADGATGIVSPDVQDGVFYFRRNHKYVLRGSTKTIFN